MQDKPVALVTEANKGIGLQIAKDLVAHGFTVLVGSRNLGNGEMAAKSVGADARPPSKQKLSSRKMISREQPTHPTEAVQPGKASKKLDPHFEATGAREGLFVFGKEPLSQAPHRGKLSET